MFVEVAVFWVSDEDGVMRGRGSFFGNWEIIITRNENIRKNIMYISSE